MADIERARQLRKQETWAENLMWRWLRDRRFSGYKFRRQHPIGDYVLDFFCEEARLNIELDGSQHGYPDQRKHDEKRERFLESYSIKTLRFWNSHLRRNAQNIRDTIFCELQTRAPHPLPDYTKPMTAADKRQCFTTALTQTLSPGRGLLHAGRLEIRGGIGRRASAKPAVIRWHFLSRGRGLR